MNESDKTTYLRLRMVLGKAKHKDLSFIKSLLLSWGFKKRFTRKQLPYVLKLLVKYEAVVTPVKHLSTNIIKQVPKTRPAILNQLIKQLPKMDEDDTEIALQTLQNFTKNYKISSKDRENSEYLITRYSYQSS